VVVITLGVDQSRGLGWETWNSRLACVMECLCSSESSSEILSACICPFVSGASLTCPLTHRTIVRLKGRGLGASLLQIVFTNLSCVHSGYTVIICVPVCLHLGIIESAFVCFHRREDGFQALTVTWI
jgi:hypothetical protein